MVSSGPRACPYGEANVRPLPFNAVLNAKGANVDVGDYLSVHRRTGDAWLHVRRHVELRQPHFSGKA